MFDTSKKVALVIGITASFSASFAMAANVSNNQLRNLLNRENVHPVTPPAAQPPALVELGRNLFFEKEISGRRNTSCATCHSVVLGSADAQSQSRGQGALGLGPYRQHDMNGTLVPSSASRNGVSRSFKFLPRNTLSLWNRGVDGWDTMFWDGRLGQRANGSFFSPAGSDTPQTFSNALAAFSIIPITPDDEMRGFVGQRDASGRVNEMANLTNDDFAQIWPLVTARVTNHPAYNKLLKKAFPGVPKKDLDIVDLAEALGAFMTEEFTALDSDFDRYLAGDNSAMSQEAKNGAALFYGKANCSGCHSGALQTDFDFHNIAAPQVGTGRGIGESSLLDFGRGAITNKLTDKFKFRTPSLRNIELEAPYFHNGAYAKLEDAVRHHLNPVSALANYDISQIEPELRGLSNTGINSTLLATISPRLALANGPLTNDEVQEVMAFLSSLTDPASLNLLQVVPDELPSGLPLAN